VVDGVFVWHFGTGFIAAQRLSVWLLAFKKEPFLRFKFVLFSLQKLCEPSSP